MSYFLFWSCLAVWLAMANAASMDSLHDSTSSAPSGPRIVITPSTSVVYLDSHGPSKVFTCRTEGDKPGMFSQLKWSGPDRVDNYDELRQRHSIVEEVPNSNSWDLELIRPTVDDSGTYHCRGTYHSTDVHNASIVIKVVNPIKLDNCHDRQFIIKGSTDAKITCRITGDAPRVTLWKNNTRIQEFEGRYRWDNDGGLIINGEVETSDAGVYSLRVTNDVTGERKVQTIHVEVHTKPEITPYAGSQEQAEFTSSEGDRAELKCRVAGNPRPLVYWLDPKLRNLTSVGGYHVNPEAGTLLIDRVSRADDHGDFQCTAINTVSSTSRSVSMAVHTKPQVLSFENVTVDEGSEVTLECRSSGDPQPSFSIRKQGNNQLPYRFGDEFTRDMSTASEGAGSNLYVHRVKILATRSQFGLHYCNATNKAGSAERVNQLFINHKPDLSFTPSEQFVKPGRRMTVTCHIRAYPEPKVTWFSDNARILNVDSSLKTTPDGQTHIVTMSPIDNQPTTFQRFVCRAENKMGYAEQFIIPKFTTAPGIVTPNIVDRSPTSVKLQLIVSNDGGDRIKYFKYRADGRAIDVHNPMYNFRDDRQNETTLEASLSPTVPYTIRNLLPYHSYRFIIRAVNDVGEGEPTEVNIETQRPTRPDPPVIIKPSIQHYNQQSALGVPSDYQNGYLLKWGPPESDNGDPVSMYIVKYGRLEANSLDMLVDSEEERIVEQMNERPMNVKIGPLEVNQRYRIQLRARNKFGDSEPAQVIIHTLGERPLMSEFQPETLAWLTVEVSTPALIIILIVAIVLLVSVDIIFCFCFQMGVFRTLQNNGKCCLLKTSSVNSDTNLQ